MFHKLSPIVLPPNHSPPHSYQLLIV